MIRNLGRALSVIIAQEAAEVVAHADVSAFNAPSECHSLVERHMERRRRWAVARAEEIAGVPWAEIRREAEDRGFAVYGPAYDRAVSRVLARMEYPG